jgi:8-oxo-dGTP pyrophosphatase MutT (NUDIX family)
MAHLGKPASWEKKESEILADCRIFKVSKSRFHHPVREKDGEFFTIDAPDWITVVATTSKQKLVTVRQYRFGIEDLSLEVPAGLVEPNEEPMEAGVRELREETGFEGLDAELLGWVYPNPAIQGNRCYLVGIREARQVAKPDWDEHEEIEIQLIPLKEMVGRLTQGDFRHALTLCALQYYMLKYPD